MRIPQLGPRRTKQSPQCGVNARYRPFGNKGTVGRLVDRRLIIHGLLENLCEMVDIAIHEFRAFHFGPSDVRIALDLILRKALPLEALISGEYSLADLAQAFEELEAGRAIKLAIRPGAEGAA